MCDAQTKYHPAHPAMKDIQFFVTNSRQHRDEVDLAAQRNQQWCQRCRHQSRADRQWRGAIASMPAIVWSDGERHGKEYRDSHEQENQDAERRQSETVGQSATQTTVGNPSSVGLLFVQECRLLPFHAGAARSRVGVEIKRGEIDERGHQDEGGIIPCQPMAIVILLVIRYGRLREVVGSIKRRTAIIVAARIGQGEVLDTGDVRNTVHVQIGTESLSEISREQEDSPVSGENVKTAKCEARGDLPFCGESSHTSMSSIDEYLSNFLS